MTATETDYEAKAKEAAGNWQKFECFIWSHGDIERPEDCMHYALASRDSGLLEQSNAAAIKKEMARFKTAWIETHSHWGPGWVEVLIVRVYDSKGKITKAFKRLYELMESLEDYAILDETDYCNREYEATVENIGYEGSIDELLAQEVYSWLSDNEEREVESRDDRGGYPSSESIRRALVALGQIEPEDGDEEPALNPFNPGKNDTTMLLPFEE